MNAIFIITAIIILLYLAYPLWLELAAGKAGHGVPDNNEAARVTMILLSYNGREYLEEKIDQLLRELKTFKEYEMIIVDDHSQDGSQDLLLQYRGEKQVQVILKDEHRGIPHTMNMAVMSAKYEYIVFCDQRQATDGNILRKLVAPLGRKEVGAVSACISHVDKAGCASFIRRYENFLKTGESRAGSLMGVYGPLYAIKKSCYVPIPEPIILDDLYLSLNIMSSSKIIFEKDCKIVDEHICTLHDYRRIRRYLTGFLQILASRKLLSRLPGKQLIMLIWHKYLRLLIPVMLSLCYVTTGILSFQNLLYLIPFGLLTILGIASLTPAFYRLKSITIHFARINILYVLAMGELLFRLVHPAVMLQPEAE